MILGQPKTLDEFPKLQPSELDRVVAVVSALLEQGIPLDIPQGLLLGDLCRLVRTARDGLVVDPEVTPMPTPEPERPRLIIPGLG